MTHTEIYKQFIEDIKQDISFTKDMNIYATLQDLDRSFQTEEEARDYVDDLPDDIIEDYKKFHMKNYEDTLKPVK